jgi:hypothetical protein
VAETETIAKLVMVLGIVFIFVGLLYPGQDSGWTDFEDTIRNLPEFSNPLRTTGIAVLHPYQDDPTLPPTDASNDAGVSECDISDVSPYWGCISQGDDNGSYVWSTTNQFRVDIRSPSGGGLPVISVYVTVQMRVNSADESEVVSVFLEDDLENPQWFSEPDTLFASDEFQDVTFGNAFDTPYPVMGSFNPGAVVITGQIDVSNVVVTLTYLGTADCTGADTLTYIGCVLAGLFNTIVNAIGVVIGGIIFIGQILVYLLSIVVAFISMVAFFFAVPDAPPVVQGVFTAFIIGALALIIIAIITRVRGSGATG